MDCLEYVPGPVLDGDLGPKSTPSAKAAAASEAAAGAALAFALGRMGGDGDTIGAAGSTAFGDAVPHAGPWVILA